jgi:hypothetical protein
MEANVYNKVSGREISAFGVTSPNFHPFIAPFTTNRMQGRKGSRFLKYFIGAKLKGGVVVCSKD